jgi:hypothetical protein
MRTSANVEHLARELAGVDTKERSWQSWGCTDHNISYMTLVDIMFICFVVEVVGGRSTEKAEMKA